MKADLIGRQASFFIPEIYTEEHLRDCMDSVARQLHSDLEVLMVDDGSTDGSGKICDEYEQRDDRFRAIHTENHGVGTARNRALSEAKGDFCFFLDADDLLLPNSISHLYALICQENADIAIGAVQRFSHTIEYEPKDEVIATYRGKDSIIQNIVFDKNDLKSLEDKEKQPKVDYGFTSCLYRMEIIREKKIRFLKITYGEDTFFCFSYLLEAQTAVTTDFPVYWYRRNLSSTTYRYHDNYLQETKEYYSSYYNLFHEKALKYIDFVEAGLNVQYYRRCISAIERELFFSPEDRTTKQRTETIGEIRADHKFQQYFTFKNLKFTPKGKFRVFLKLVKINCYRLAVIALDRLTKK